MIHRRLMLVFACLILIPANLWSQDDREEDKKAISDAIQGYVEAMNKRDATAAAAFWSDSGVWIDPKGEAVVGSAAIKDHLTKLFAGGDAPQIELLDVNVRFLSPLVATEEGDAVLHQTGELPEKATYIAIHVKTDNGWKLDSVRQTVIPAPDSHHEHLRELEWMIGSWVDESENASVETSCEWTKNKNFMLRTFKATLNGEVQLEGTQVVGWDAARRQIRSWIFDSDGGFGQGLWTREGNSWIIQQEFQLADGGLGTSNSRYTFVDANSFTYESFDRVIDGEALPDIEKITIKRVAESD